MKVKLLQSIGANVKKHAKDTVHDFEENIAKELIKHKMAVATDDPVTEDKEEKPATQKKAGAVASILLFFLASLASFA